MWENMDFTPILHVNNLLNSPPASGLKMLTNQKRGDFYGVVSNWQSKQKRELGVHLLYRAMQIFLAEGERQLRPVDIRQ